MIGFQAIVGLCGGADRRGDAGQTMASGAGGLFLSDESGGLGLAPCATLGQEVAARSASVEGVRDQP